MLYKLRTNANGTNKWCINGQGAIIEGGSNLNLLDDGNLYVFGKNGNIIWCSKEITSRLKSGEKLESGKSITSPNQAYQLKMQEDGNMCIANADGKNIWCINSYITSKTIGKGKCLKMQEDGNLCIADTNDTNLWCINSFKNVSIQENSYLSLLNNGDLCVFDENGNIVWSRFDYSGQDLQFEIEEVMLEGQGNSLKQVTIETIQSPYPREAGNDTEKQYPAAKMELPGYDFESKKEKDSKDIFTFTPSEAPYQYFGESDVPDRKLVIDNLDIIQHQNVGAGIWMSRNKELVDGQTTNPKFVFQTPYVKFNARLTPFIINDIRWDINDLNTTGNKIKLELHLKNLFMTLLPENQDMDYQIRIGCRYAFAMVKGKNMDDHLMTEVPVLLGNPKVVEVGKESDIRTNYAENLAKDISGWYTKNNPSVDDGYYIFNFNIFSSQSSNLPLLKIDYLSLKLSDIDLDT